MSTRDDELWSYGQSADALRAAEADLTGWDRPNVLRAEAGWPGTLEEMYNEPFQEEDDDA